MICLLHQNYFALIHAAQPFFVGVHVVPVAVVEVALVYRQMLVSVSLVDVVGVLLVALHWVVGLMLGLMLGSMVDLEGHLLGDVVEQGVVQVVDHV